MVRRLVLVLLLLAPTFGCGEDDARPGDDGGADAAPPTMICSCPCMQIEVPAADHCWTTSCVPFCGPGSGNAC